MAEDTYEEERTVTVARAGLADLDEALAWVLRVVEREQIERPSIVLRPLHVMDAEASLGQPNEWREEYEASVSGASGVPGPGR